MKFLLRNLIHIVLWLSAVHQSMAEEAIHVSTGEYPPGFSEFSPHHGYIVHILTEAYKKVGVKVIIQFQPWKRAYQSGKDGRVDGTCCWFPSSERESDFYLSDSITDIEGFYLFHLKGFKFDWNTLEDLGELNMGVTSGYTFGDAFYRAEKEGRLQLNWVTTDEQNLRKLYVGRVDITPMGVSTGYELIRKIFTPKQAKLFTHHPKPLRKTPTHFLLPRNKHHVEKSKRLLGLFNQGLKKLKQSGEYDKIIQGVFDGKYNMKKEIWRPEK